MATAQGREELLIACDFLNEAIVADDRGRDPWIKRCKKLAKVGCWRRGWLEVDDLIVRGVVGEAEPNAKL